MNTIENLTEYLKNSVSPFHMVGHSIDLLDQAGFIPLSSKESWTLEKGKGYYCRTFSGELFAFKIGRDADLSKGVHIGGAHTDWPCLRVKPNGTFNKKGYLQINAEIYGGPILSTFFDRPLSIAGRLALKSEDLLNPDVVYVDLKKPVLTIPNLAIHMSRSEENAGGLDKQTHLMPLCAMVNETLNQDDYLLRYIAGSTGVKYEDILDFELYIYNPEEPQLVGLNGEFLSSPRLDNATSACALIYGLMDSSPSDRISQAALYDNEEIGSRTKQGADSQMLSIILEKIWASLGRDRISFLSDIQGSMILSVDVGHGFHPNYPASYDITTYPKLGSGFVIKMDSNQKYTWDCEAVGGLMNLCQTFGIPYQRCVKRTGQAGGGTIGSPLSAQVPVKTVDIGVPLLAMHSARELMGTADQISLTDAVTRFFTA